MATNNQDGQKPKGIWCRRGDALRWLQIAEDEWDDLVTSRVVTPRYLKKGGKAYFLVSEIDEKIYQPMLKGHTLQ